MDILLLSKRKGKDREMIWNAATSSCTAHPLLPPEAMRFSSLPTHLLCIFSWRPVGHLSLIVILFLYREDKPLYRKFCRVWPHENSAPLRISLMFFFFPLVARDTVFAAGAVEKALITKALSGWKLTRAKSYFCLYCCVCVCVCPISTWASLGHPLTKCTYLRASRIIILKLVGGCWFFPLWKCSCAPYFFYLLKKWLHSDICKGKICSSLNQIHEPDC